MFCKNCGSQIDDGVANCPNCGTATGVTQAATQDFRTYSPVWANQADAAAQTNAPVVAPEAPKAKKGFGGNKKILPAIIAVVLVVAIVLGIVLIATGKKPEVKTLDAAKKTVFETSEMSGSVEYKEDGEVYDGYDFDLTVGEDVDSTYFCYSYGDEDYSAKYEIKDGKLYYNGEEGDSLDELFAEWEEDLSEYYDVDIDIRAELDNILNGKIDEKAVADLFDNVFIPTMKQMIEDEIGETVELPSFDELFKDVEDLLKNKTVREALGLEKSKSSNPGTTYDFNINFKKLVRGVFEYLQEDKEYKEYLELVVDEADYDDVDELVDDFVDEADGMEKLKGSITIKSGRITHVTIKDGDAKIEIALEAK